MTLAAGTRLGPYEVIAPLGAGGMGEVYRARDTRLGRDVAIKVLPAASRAGPERLRRFEQEARRRGALNHPNILAVYDVGDHEGAPYVVTELLEGETLRERLWRRGALPPRKAIDYAIQIARGPRRRARQGHRPPRPQAGEPLRHPRRPRQDPRLRPGQADASRTPIDRTRPPADGRRRSRSRAPSSARSATCRPSRSAASRSTIASDIFSFGAVLYEMLSGRARSAETSAVETMTAILKEDPPELPGHEPRRSPPALERIVRHCLEKNPEERFQSARDLAFDLETLSDQSALSVSRGPIAGRARWLKPAAVGLAVIARGGRGLRRRPEGRRRRRSPTSSR